MSLRWNISHSIHSKKNFEQLAETVLYGDATVTQAIHILLEIPHENSA